MEQNDVTVKTNIKVTKNRDTNKIIISYYYGDIELDMDFINRKILKLLIDPSIDEVIEAIKQYQNKVAEYYKDIIENLYGLKNEG